MSRSQKSDEVKVSVNSEGQTVVNAKDLLDNPKVQQFIQEFGQEIQKHIERNPPKPRKGDND